MIQHRPRLVASCVALALALGAAGCGSDDDSSSPPSSPPTASAVTTSTPDTTDAEATTVSPGIENTNVPLTAPSATETPMSEAASATTATPEPAPSVTLSTPPNCTAADLTGTAEPMGDSVGSNTKLVVEVTNTSDRACLLPQAPPTLFALGDDAVGIPFPTADSGTYFGSPPTLDGPLAVGSTAVVWIGGGQPAACDPMSAGQTWPSMMLGLPDDSTVQFMTTFDTTCGVTGITPFGMPG